MSSLFSLPAAGLGRELRIAARGLFRHTGFAWAGVLTLGLAVGGLTAMLTVANAVLFRPLPFPDADELVSLCETNPQVAGFCVASPPNVMDWKRESRTLLEIGVARGWPMTLALEGRRVAVPGGLATEGVFAALGPQPAAGRLFLPDDERAGNRRVVLLSHSLWQTRFGGDRQIVGQSIELEDSAYTVVGVLPAGFQVPLLEDVALWTPLPFDPSAEDQRDWRGFQVFARLAPGVGPDAAREELAGIQSRLAEQYPAANREWGVALVPLHERVVGQVRPALLAFLGATVLAVLIACLNVTTLLLARWTSRRRELAVRAALGGGRGALLRMLLLESLLLALAGSVAGLLLGPWLTRLFLVLAPSSVPRLDQVTPDPVVFGVALLIGIVVPLLAGLAPALRSSRLDLAESLRATGSDGMRGREFLRRGLVVAQLGLAVMLLVGAGLLGRTFLNLVNWSPGFEREHLVTLWAYLPPGRYPTPTDARTAFREVRQELASLPGVIGVSQVSAGPVFGGRETDGFRDAGRTGDRPLVGRWYDAGPDYFAVLGAELLRGREFTDRDVEGGAPVAVVNETFARRMWPDQDPLGRVIVGEASGRQPLQVIGVLRDLAPFRAGEAPEPEVYWPFDQHTRWASYLVLRTAVDPGPIGRLAEARLAERFPDLQVSGSRTLPELVRSRLVSPRFALILIALLAGMATAISAIGVFGVVNYLVTRRTREIGIRMALGADVGSVLGSVLREGLVLVAIGAACGILGAIAAGRLIASLLAGVSPLDPVTLVLVPVGLAAVAVLAAFLPARRAARTDPLVVLRAD